MPVTSKHHVWAAGDDKFTPSYVALDGKVLRFDAFMKEDVPDIPAEVRFRIPLSRALIGCCCPPFAPADASAPNRLPAHIRNATHGRATGSGCLISATSWWTTPFESVNSNRFGLSVSFVQSLHLNMLTDGAIRSDIKRCNRHRLPCSPRACRAHNKSC